jgi:hypothetical protein
MFSKLKIAALSIAMLPILAPASRADGFWVSLTRKFHHGAVSFGFASDPFCGTTCAPRCAPVVWIPGHYETVSRPVWVEPCAEQVWVPAVYEWRYHGCGRRYRECARPGRFERVCRPGRYEVRAVQVWVEGAWRAQ